MQVPFLFYLLPVFFAFFIFQIEPWQGKFGQNKSKHPQVYQQYSIMKVGRALP